MRQAEQFDRLPAGGAFTRRFKQSLEGLPVGIAWEQLVAVYQLQQRHGFAPQAVDVMPIIDEMACVA